MEPLLDPYNDRQIKSIKPPPARPLSHQLMYPYPGTFAYNFLIIYVFKIGKPSIPDLELVRKHLLD
jgi:hypothetical protein